MESRDVSPTDRSSNGAAGSAEKDSTLAVKVAVNIRPLIGLERVQGCKDCITVVPGEPQVQLGTHSFTFDHVYGSTGTPLSAIFDECVSPLVDGLFQGFNATVLAYGQTGSGKTYTMGTGYTVGGSTEGIIPKVMETIFAKIETLKAKADFQIRVSFIEILKEEVHDLLDPSPPSTVRADLSLGGAFGDSKYSSGKPVVPGKPPIQIRETTNGGITLAGVTETDVNSLGEMAMCLEQGSLCRATGSTMMNARSSRSHAIFTITVEQRRKWETLINGANPLLEDVGEDFLCAKFHLVDLAGSERAKRTGADGLRFKEGVHINKGLLALGNVISALGDDKKRKEGGHVPYRDSKLTRLLQDSLGGNSRTVMIACVSPADSNAEETLNTLKYANRARNIQNKPTINRDPVAAEMSRMRQQLELMQAELLCARASSAPEEVQLLQQKIAWLENSNLDLRHELQVARNSIQELSQQGLDSRVQQDKLRLKLDQLRAGRTFEEIDGEDDGETGSVLKEQRLRIQELEEELRKLHLSGAPSRPRSALLSLAIGDEDAMSTLSGYSDVITNSSAMGAELPADAGAGAAEDQAKEIEYNLLQENFDKELQELNKRLEQKEAEMTRFVRSDTVVLKQHFERKLVELEEEKKTLQGERDMLANKIEKLTTTSDENAQKMKDTYVQKLKELEVQITDLRKKQENQSQHLRAKERADEAAKRLQDDIHRIKTQKVQLQQKMKQESEQFRMWKACREKELLQLRKEGRRNVYEMHKLQALNQRQKLVLQRKTEEAAMATRRLKEMLEARKSPRDSIGYGFAQNEKNLHQWLEQELEMAVRVHEVRSAYDKQMEERMALAKELASLKEERMNSSINQAPSMSPGARLARLQLLETMLNSSSSALVAMASQLSEAEERERSAGGRARWHSMRSMGDAKSLLQLAFDAAALSRCRIRDTEEEKKELKEKLLETQQLLRRSEDCRQELERLQPTISQPGVSSLTTINMLSFDAGLKKGDNRTYKTAEIRHRTGVENGIPDPVSSRNNTIPYSLRKIGRRDETSSKYALPDQTSNSSEGESDMDTNSDDEWKEDSEKQAVKRNRALGGYSGLSKLQSKSVSLDRKSRVSSSHHGLHSLDEESVEVHEEDNEDPKGSRERCSCKSGCKTKKCKCKAAGGLCGTLCGCIATKCNNREAVAVEEGRSFSVAPPIQVEVAQELALTGVDKNSRRLDGASEAAEHVSGGKSPLHIVTEDEHVTKRAERLLAAHGASLLDSAWNDEFEVSADSNKESQPEERQRDGRVETTDDDKLVPHRHRKPLQDIGNKVSTKGKAGGKRGKQRQTSLVQLVTSGEPPNTGTGTAATTASPAASQPDATAVTAATIHTPTAAAASVIVPATAAAPIAAPCSVVPLAAIPDVTVNPLWRQQSLQRRISTGQVSPLRLRDNKVGAFNSSSGGGGGGTSGDNNVTQAGVVKNPKAATASSATGPGSPSTTGAGRGTDGKENIHRNSFV